MEMINAQTAVKYPLSTEKSLRLMESENTLVFIVDRKATKQEIKADLEKRFKVKIITVRTLISTKGKKKAYIKFHDDTPAIDIATNLGLI